MRAGAGADVLVVVEDVVGVVRALHIHQPVVDRGAVRLADPVGVFVAAEKVDVDAFAERAEGGEKSLRPGSVPVAEVLAGPPHGVEGDRVRWRIRRSRVRCRTSTPCRSALLTGTKCMLGRVTASQIASEPLDQIHDVARALRRDNPKFGKMRPDREVMKSSACRRSSARL